MARKPSNTAAVSEVNDRFMRLFAVFGRNPRSGGVLREGHFHLEVVFAAPWTRIFQDASKLGKADRYTPW
jgi:hypothetical protein